MLQKLIEAETATKIGAEWNEHTETRTAYRSGHRDKTLTTQAGDLDLAIRRPRPRPDCRGRRYHQGAWRG
ncbi:transposase [Streptomyces mirabilis]|uniref:transposase n=1 Tax=Streptomyces mirabilis TaxID=68239 RepID=UPI0036B9EF95